MLKVFDLSHNGLGDDGALAFIDALKVNTTLTELDVRYIPTPHTRAANTDIHYLHVHTATTDSPLPRLSTLPSKSSRLVKFSKSYE